MIVSRRHCEFNQDQGQLTIRDLGSRNGTYVNGLKIDKIQLNAGDKLNIGPLAFAVQIDGVPANDSSILQQPEHVKDADELISDDSGEFDEFADSEEFADIDDLDLSEPPQGPGQSSTEFFDGLPEEFPEDNNSQ
jgi:pSer/pThr/pTyr-binding forkhead associated (FHA) protein